MIRVALCCVFWCVLAALCVPARAESVLADISDDFVAVSAGFRGMRLTLFGAIQPGSDVAVIVKGPPMKGVLREKKRVMGIWANGATSTYPDMPGYYAIAASQPVQDSLPFDLIRDNGLSLDDLLPPSGDPEAWSHLVALRRKDGLYLEPGGTIRITDRRLFRAQFDLPANVPLGAYSAKVFVMRNNRITANRAVPFSVEAVGVEARLKELAENRSFAYAGLCIAVSLGIGALASLVLRRA